MRNNDNVNQISNYETDNDSDLADEYHNAEEFESDSDSESDGDSESDSDSDSTDEYQNANSGQSSDESTSMDLRLELKKISFQDKDKQRQYNLECLRIKKELKEAKMKFKLEMKEKQNAAEANQMTHQEKLRVVDIKETQMKEHIKLTNDKEEFDRKRIQDAINDVKKSSTRAIMGATATGIGGAGVSVGVAAAVGGVALTLPVGVVVAGIVVGAGSLSGGISALKTAYENIQAKKSEIELLNNDIRKRKPNVIMA